jgi:SSS family solute:Na+ symporter
MRQIDFDKVIPTLLTAHLPPFFMAVILLLILSASMSTLSSLVLVSSSVITVDIYQGFINPGISKKNALLMIRVLSGIFVIFSLIVAKFKIAIIVTLMSLSWELCRISYGAYFFHFSEKNTQSWSVFWNNI